MGRAAPIGGGVLLVILAIAFLTGKDPTRLLDLVDQTQVSVDPGSGAGPSAGAPTDEVGDFVSVVLADTEDTWRQLFAQTGQTYRDPTVVLITDAVSSACGFNSAAVGPFYCPADQQVYIDLAFFSDLDRRFGAPGDFAQAYVIAHEVGHHVQNLLGISEQVRRMRSRMSRQDANALSVRQELQAPRLAWHLVVPRRSQPRASHGLRGPGDDSLRPCDGLARLLHRGPTGLVLDDVLPRQELSHLPSSRLDLV